MVDRTKSNGIYMSEITIKKQKSYAILKKRLDKKTIFYSISDKKYEG